MKLPSAECSLMVAESGDFGIFVVLSNALKISMNSKLKSDPTQLLGDPVKEERFS